MWSRFHSPDERSGRTQQERNNRTPHPVDMKYAMARRHRTAYAQAGGVFTTETPCCLKIVQIFIEVGEKHLCNM